MQDVDDYFRVASRSGEASRKAREEKVRSTLRGHRAVSIVPSCPNVESRMGRDRKRHNLTSVLSTLISVSLVSSGVSMP